MLLFAEMLSNFYARIPDSTTLEHRCVCTLALRLVFFIQAVRPKSFAADNNNLYLYCRYIAGAAFVYEDEQEMKDAAEAYQRNKKKV